MKFEGCFIFPHGCSVTLSLWVATAAGAAATSYALGSCRLVVIDYISSIGGFADLASEVVTNRIEDVESHYKTAAGLFNWLEPIATTNVYDEGTCQGYTQTMRETFSDPLLESIRSMAVVAILLALFVVFWVFLLSTFSQNRWYHRALIAAYCIECILVILCCALIFQSGLCQNVANITTKGCEWDEGGLVGIAAAVTWLACVLLSAFFLKPMDDFLIQAEGGEIVSSYEQRRQDRKEDQRNKYRTPEKKTRKKRREEEEEEEEDGDEEDLARTPETYIATNEEGGVELYL